VFKHHDRSADVLSWKVAQVRFEPRMDALMDEAHCSISIISFEQEHVDVPTRAGRCLPEWKPSQHEATGRAPLF